MFSIVVFFLIVVTFQIIVWDLPEISKGVLPEKVYSCYNKVKNDFSIKAQCNSNTRTKWFSNGQEIVDQKHICCTSWDYIDCTLLEKGKLKCHPTEYEELKKYWNENHKQFEQIVGQCLNYPYPSTSPQCKNSSMSVMSTSLLLWITSLIAVWQFFI